jgi:hypothetical protein
MKMVQLHLPIATCNQTPYSPGPWSLSIAVLRTTYRYRKSMQKSKFGCWPAAGRDLPVFWPSEATFYFNSPAGSLGWPAACWPRLHAGPGRRAGDWPSGLWGLPGAGRCPMGSSRMGQQPRRPTPPPRHLMPAPPPPPHGGAPVGACTPVGRRSGWAAAQQRQQMWGRVGAGWAALL